MSREHRHKVQQTNLVIKLIEDLKSTNLDVALNAANGLCQLGESVIPELAQALKISPARHKIASILGQLRDPRAVLPLIELLITDTYDLARYSAALALGKLGDKRATKPLINTLSDPDSAVRHAAASALGDLRDETAVLYLINALEDSDWELRQQAAYSLGQIGSNQALQPLIEALHDEYSEVRERVVLALGMLGMKEALQSLISVQEYDKGESFEGHKVSDAASRAIDAIRNKVGREGAPEIEIHNN